MALLTIPSVTKGTAASVSLNKTDLFALSAVAADAYFSDSANVKRCVIELNSDPGNQRKILDFDLSQASPTASLLISAKGRNSFLLERMILEDNDGGLLILERSQLPSGFDVSLGGGGGSSNPVDPNTVLLLNFENSSIDSAKQLTATELGAVLYGAGKFGQAFNASSGVLKYTMGDDFVFGTGSWCIETQMKSLGDSGNRYWLRTDDPALSFYIGFVNRGLRWYANGLDSDYTGGWEIGGRIEISPVASAVWHHFAMSYDATTSKLRIFWDGVKRFEMPAAIAFGGNGAGSTNSPTHPIWVGAYNDNGLFQSNLLLDNLRISKGASRYTENFTPPTAPLT